MPVAPPRFLLDPTDSSTEPWHGNELGDGLVLWTKQGLAPSSMLDQVLRDPGARPDRVAVLKKARRRHVLRVALDDPPFSLIVKAFPLDLAARIHYTKYAPTEVRNYEKARTRGLPIPTLLGYFERRRAGLVALTGLLVEDLRGWTSLHELLERKPAERTRCFSRRCRCFARFTRAARTISTPPRATSWSRQTARRYG